MQAELGQAIVCNCYIKEFDRYKILGSVTSAGFLEILRSHKNKTIIETEHFLIKCQDCGYTKFVQIKSMAVNQPASYEKQN